MFDGDYIVFFEGLRRLRNLGIVERIERAKAAGNLLPLDDIISPDSVREAAYRLKQGGFYNFLPNQKEHFNSLNSVFKDLESGQALWKVNRSGAETREAVSLHDFSLLIGDSAAQVLKPEEFADYQKNGFDSFSAWVGCVGALVERTAKDLHDVKAGYMWNSILPKRRMLNLVGGNIHGDLFVEQTDLTEYSVIDPLGNPALYRPLFSQDNSFIAPHHSTEIPLLVATLDFIDQTRTRSEIVDDNASSLINRLRNSQRRHGAFAEAGETSSLEDVFFSFIKYGRPMLRFMTDGTFVNTITYALAREGLRSSCVACVTPAGNFGFFELESGKSVPASPNMRVEFQPFELDRLIDGLAYQSLNGLGRTHPENLARVLEYRFSRS